MIEEYIVTILLSVIAGLITVTIPLLWKMSNTLTRLEANIKSVRQSVKQQDDKIISLENRAREIEMRQAGQQ